MTKIKLKSLQSDTVALPLQPCEISSLILIMDYIIK